MCGNKFSLLKYEKQQKLIRTNYKTEAVPLVTARATGRRVS
jgi:hypothetical protein